MGPLPLALILARTMNSLSFPVKSFSLGLGLGLGSGIPNPNPNPNPNPSPNPSPTPNPTPNSNPNQVDACVPYSSNADWVDALAQQQGCAKR